MFGVPALLALVAVFGFRDAIVALAPGLAPMLPPKAVAQPAPAPMAPAEQVVEWADGAEGVLLAIMRVATLALVLAGFLVPLILPPVLSRRGYLSVGRWVIFAGLGVFLMGPAVVAPAVFLPFIVPAGAALAVVFSWTCGCLIAAAIHPKTPPTPHP